MAGTMGTFYVGVTGMQSHQYALNTTAHNITNAGRDTYSRQQVLLSDLAYVKLGTTYTGPNQSGLGTHIQDVRLVRDTFLDTAYREEFGREEFYQTKYDVIDELQNYFGEEFDDTNNSSFRKYMKNLWTAAEELQKESNSIVTRSSYIASAVSFVEQATQIYDHLTNFQMKLNSQIVDQVDRINELAQTIYDLNYQITMVEAAGIESANDYRDQRDAALDELGGLVSISYQENNTGQVDVYAEHRTLVSMDRVYEITTMQVSDSCEFLKPIWKDDQADLFNLRTVPNSDNGNDVGSLKGIIMSRGNWITNYTDIPIAPKMPAKPIRSAYATDEEYQDAMTNYQTDYQQYQKDYEVFSKERDAYNTYLEPYTVSNIVAQFDQLIHGVITRINDILCPNKELTVLDENGNETTIHVLDEEKAGYGMGANNRVQGTELFLRMNVPRYVEQEVTLADGSKQTYQVYNEEYADDFLTLYTLGNLEINDELIRNPSLLPLTNLQQEELQDVADQLIKVWEEDFATLGPDSLVTNNFMGYYKEFVADFANKGKTYNGIAESQNQAVQEINNQRQTVVGVSTDEELSNLIRFQQGYNASSRYFTVVSEMIEHLINKLG
ncbi:MAG: flagellar hook-associated protein FlgK [Eubacteriales bacterium]|nr:flagellar hook-associated protein FlgK [Eubacteriales bacterium]